MTDASSGVPTPTLPLRTERLLIRPLTPADIDPMTAYKSLPEVVRWIPYPPLTRDDVAARIANVWARTEFTEPGQSITLGLEELATGRLVGDVVLFWHSDTDRSGEVGYVLSPEATGRGYATEATGALLDVAFGELGLHRVTARVDERNPASVRVLERLGFRNEGRLVESSWTKGEWVTLLVFGLLEGEWPG